MSQYVSPTAKLGRDVVVHESSYVDDECVIGAGTRIWHFCHVQQGAHIGIGCSLGQNVNIGSMVKIGNGVRIQNNVSVFEGVVIENDVFCGPSMTFTNVLNPRAKYPHGVASYVKTRVREGATIGANVTIVCGNTLGRHCFIAAGALVTKNVPDHAFMLGAPAKQDGWITELGRRLPADLREDFICEESGKIYAVSDNKLVVRS